MGNVDDAAAVVPELADDPEQLIDLFGGQCGGRLIHDKHPGVDGKSLGDFHHLLLGHRQIAHRLAGGNVDAQIVQNLLCLRLHGLPIHGEALHLFPAQEHIFRHAQVGAHIQLLMDNRNTQLLRLFGTQVIVGFAEDLHCAAVSGVDAAENFHQRGFARAVLSQQSHDFTGTQFKVNIVQRFHTGEALANTLHGNNGFVHLLTHLSHIGFSQKILHRFLVQILDNTVSFSYCFVK